MFGIKAMFVLIWLFYGVTPLVLYETNYNNVRTRYWGKNKKWLKETTYYNLFVTTAAVLIILFAV
jgi:hypothetical protein